MHSTTGGTLRIFGEALSSDVPYRTLLLAIEDSASHVIKETLEKYGKEAADPEDYCLVQVGPKLEQHTVSKAIFNVQGRAARKDPSNHCLSQSLCSLYHYLG